MFGSSLPLVQSRETGYTWRRKTKHKHHTICVGHHYAEASTNNVNKTWALIETIGGKDEPNIVCYAAIGHKTQNG
jgi:hypothetical protein